MQLAYGDRRSPVPGSAHVPRPSASSLTSLHREPNPSDLSITHCLHWASGGWRSEVKGEVRAQPGPEDMSGVIRSMPSAAKLSNGSKKTSP